MNAQQGTFVKSATNSFIPDSLCKVPNLFQTFHIFQISWSDNIQEERDRKMVDKNLLPLPRKGGI